MFGGGGRNGIELQTPPSRCSQGSNCQPDEVTRKARDAFVLTQRIHLFAQLNVKSRVVAFHVRIVLGSHQFDHRTMAFIVHYANALSTATDDVDQPVSDVREGGSLTRCYLIKVARQHCHSRSNAGIPVDCQYLGCPRFAVVEPKMKSDS